MDDNKMPNELIGYNLKIGMVKFKNPNRILFDVVSKVYKNFLIVEECKYSASDSNADKCCDWYNTDTISSLIDVTMIES